MKYRFKVPHLCVLKRLFIVLLLSPYTLCAQAELRDWKVTDSIGIRRFSGNQDLPFNTVGPRDARFFIPSPNDEYFFVESWRGLIADDSNEFELAVYDVSAISRSLRKGTGATPTLGPVATVSMKSFSSVEAGIRNASWAHDSSGILFRGMTKNGTMQMHYLGVPSGKVEQLSAVEYGVLSFTQLDNVILFTALNAPPPETVAPVYPFRALDRASDGMMKFTVPPGYLRTSSYLASRGRLPIKLSGSFISTAVSPNGKWAIGVQDIESKWRFLLIDLTRGEVTDSLTAAVGPMTVDVSAIPASDERIGMAHDVALPVPEAIWSRDSKRAILVNLRDESDRDAKLVVATPDGGGFIATYDLANNRWQAFESVVAKISSAAGATFRYVKTVKKIAPENDDVLVTYGNVGQADSHALYKLRQDGWRVEKGSFVMPLAQPAQEHKSAELVKDVSIVLRQSANEPPTLIAKFGVRESSLTVVDKALDGVWRAPKTPLQWRESDGIMYAGGLVLPRSVPPSGLPLVIQVTHNYLPEYFMPDGGMTTTAYAAQALAAKGMAVLELQYVEDSGSLAAQEGPRIVKRIDAAVEELARRGIIDPARVGVTGHSRTGYQIFYTLTHPGRTKLAAAFCSDSFTGSYSNYLQRGATQSLFRVDEFETMPSGPFWRRKSEWLQHETTFNVDRIRTPTLLTLHGLDMSSETFGSTEIIGAFRLNRKPLEVLYFPKGYHFLVRPSERIAEMTAVVEWMEFWLQGKMPATRDRSASWTHLKEQQREVLSEPARPLVKWVAVPAETTDPTQP